MKKPQKPRSPLKQRPLRYAGQSIDEQIDDLLTGSVVTYVLVAMTVVLIAMLEWIHWLSPTRQMPVFVTVVAFCVVCYSAFRISNALKQVKVLQMARDGEKEVAECLDSLRERGYAVFHDILGDGFNIDHVILSPHGIFTVETKTRSKPHQGDARVVYDGSRVLVNGRESDRDVVQQAESQAVWLRNLLRESTGKVFRVRAIVVFPGWFVEQTRTAREGHIWVLNPKGVPVFIGNESVCMPKEDVHLAAFHLARYVRTYQRQSVEKR